MRSTSGSWMESFPGTCQRSRPGKGHDVGTRQEALLGWEQAHLAVAQPKLPYPRARTGTKPQERSVSLATVSISCIFLGGHDCHQGPDFIFAPVALQRTLTWA